MSGNTVRFRAGLGNRKRRPVPVLKHAADTPRPPATRLARQLALAYFIEGEIEDGRLKTYAEVAGRLGISRARVSQIAGMVLLPVNFQEAILGGEVAVSERELRLLTGRVHSSGPLCDVASSSTQSSSSQVIPLRPGTFRVGPAR